MVELAVVGQREHAHGHERGRHHELGHGRRRVRAQGGLDGLERLPGVRYRVGDKLFLALVVLDRHDRDAGNGQVPRQRRFDLFEFDPKAADLDPFVKPPGEFRRGVRVPTHHVARAVHPFPGRA
jgi:hypothetical protein